MGQANHIAQRVPLRGAAYLTDILYTSYIKIEEVNRQDVQTILQAEINLKERKNSIIFVISISNFDRAKNRYGHFSLYAFPPDPAGLNLRMLRLNLIRKGNMSAS
jgi:hypothetical protein